MGVNSQYEPRDLTLQEVADCFDITRERIRQIEAKALKKNEATTNSTRK